jgi:hypothetical protein
MAPTYEWEVFLFSNYLRFAISTLAAPTHPVSPGEYVEK